MRPTQGNRAKLNTFRAKREELKYLKEKGELLAASEVRKTWADQLLKWREIVNQWDIAPEKKAELLKELAK